MPKPEDRELRDATCVLVPMRTTKDTARHRVCHAHRTGEAREPREHSAVHSTRTLHEDEAMRLLYHREAKVV